MSEASLPPRPAPPRSLRDQAIEWLTWLGPVRLISSVVAIAIVVGGGYWLVRTPAPTTEAGLPTATATPPVVAATLPPPSTVIATTTTSPPAIVVVHVAGAVRVPGVYRLDGDERVHAAIAAAGGASGKADLDGLNLAAGVADGQRIYVPSEGEVDPASVPSVSLVGPGTSDGAPDASATGPVDLNRASAAELESLPGIGPATAAAIIDDRERNGPFASVDDLDRVSGIGPSKLAAIRDRATV